MICVVVVVIIISSKKDGWGRQAQRLSGRGNEARMRRVGCEAQPLRHDHRQPTTMTFDF